MGKVFKNFIKNYWNPINENLAIWISDKFNTIECFWILLAFSLSGLMPVLLPINSIMLYISNCIQLVALPLLGFSMVVIERRNKITHQELNEKHIENQELLKDLESKHADNQDQIHSLHQELTSVISEKHDAHISTLEEISKKIDSLTKKIK
jgi:DNA anti-recombination protein RmuC